MIKIGKDISSWGSYSCQPKNREELKEIIKKRISEQGNGCDLNDIDTSLITNMSYLFSRSDFNGDISKWNISNVEDMFCMFFESKFNKDISKWNVSNTKYMNAMFAHSNFNHDISKWNIDKACDTFNMFARCPIKDEFRPKS